MTEEKIIYRFVMHTDNQNYFYTGTIISEDENFIIIQDRKSGETRLNKKFLVTMYEVKQ